MGVELRKWLNIIMWRRKKNKYFPECSQSIIQRKEENSLKESEEKSNIFKEEKNMDVVRFENLQLREEVDRLKKLLQKNNIPIP